MTKATNVNLHCELSMTSFSCNQSWPSDGGMSNCQKRQLLKLSIKVPTYLKHNTNLSNYIHVCLYYKLTTGHKLIWIQSSNCSNCYNILVCLTQKNIQIILWPKILDLWSMSKSTRVYDIGY